jgi:anti-sigma regulatory factor (Ser/Thr protein kinase)
MDSYSAPSSIPCAIVSDYCQLRIPSHPDRIAGTIDWLVRRATECGGISHARANRVMIALHEALTNSVIHGNLGISSELKERGDAAFAEAVAARCADPAFAGRSVDIRASYDGLAMRWVVCDQGEGFDVERILRRLESDEPDPMLSSGRGLFMIRAFVDEMRYENGGRRLTLTVHRNEEKRTAPRYPFAQVVHVAPIVDGLVNWANGHEALARDISKEGIGLLQSRLAESSHVYITIPTPGEPVSLRAVVRHWQQVGDKVEVGCRFETGPATPPTGEAAGSKAVAALVDRLLEQKKPSEERRGAPRLPYTRPIQIEVPDRPPLPGFTRDISHSGIAFYTTGSLPLVIVRISLPGDGSSPAIQTRVRIVRCTRVTDGFHDVAAQFLL